MEDQDFGRLDDRALREWRAGTAARELIDECMAFLDGGYVEHLERRHVPVPVWAWTNLLAHGTERSLRRAIVSASKRREETWPLCQAYLAGSVLSAAPDFGDLRGLQSSVLVPLELRLSALPAVESWPPGEWVNTVMTAISGERET